MLGPITQPDREHVAVEAPTAKLVRHVEAHQRSGVQTLSPHVLLERTESGIERREVLPVRFVPMTGEAETRR